MILNGCAGKDFAWHDASIVKLRDSDEESVDKTSMKLVLIIHYRKHKNHC